MIRVIKLNKEYLIKNIEKFKEIDKVIWDEEGNWTDEKFLKDLKGKWDFSFAVEVDDEPTGFAICSIKENDLYIHRFAVAKGRQNKGMGSKLIEYILENCKENRIGVVNLQVKKINMRAQRFYKRYNFKRIGERGLNYIYRKVIP